MLRKTRRLGFGGITLWIEWEGNFKENQTMGVPLLNKELHIHAGSSIFCGSTWKLVSAELKY